MNITKGNGTTQYGPGVSIELTGDEVAIAIDAWLVAQSVIVNGPRTITVNGDLINNGNIYVDPSGNVIDNGKNISCRWWERP